MEVLDLGELYQDAYIWPDKSSAHPQSETTVWESAVRCVGEGLWLRD